jgi:hypothetical protein
MLDLSAARLHKSTQILTQTPLAASGVFTSVWFDTNLTGDCAAAAVENHAGAGGSQTNGFQIQGSNDIVTPGPIIVLNLTGAVGAGATNVLTAYISTRYWRVQYTNGTTTEVGGPKEISVTSSNYVTNLQVTTPGGGSNLVYANQLAVTLAPNSSLDPGASDSLSVFKYASVDNTFSGGPATPMFVFAGSPGGVTASGLRTPNIFKTLAAVAVTAGTPVAVWTPAAGKKFRLMGYTLSLSVAGSIILEDATGVEKIRTPLMAAGVGMISPQMGNGILSALANNALFIDVTATGTVNGFVYGTEE